VRRASTRPREPHRRERPDDPDVAVVLFGEKHVFNMPPARRVKRRDRLEVEPVA
jgi:hypothetical protein